MTSRSAETFIRHPRSDSDVTERDQATCQVTSYGYLECLLNHANVPIIAWSPKLEIILFNQALQRLTGIDFLRTFLHPSDPESLTRHIMYGIEIGGEDVICFGADYFSVATHPDQSRAPFFFEEHSDATSYQSILQSLQKHLGKDQLHSLAFGNGIRFIQELWG